MLMNSLKGQLIVPRSRAVMDLAHCISSMLMNSLKGQLIVPGSCVKVAHVVFLSVSQYICSMKTDR